MSAELLTALLVGQQQHDPPGAVVHIALVAGVVVAGLVLFGISRWRARRDATEAEKQSAENSETSEGR
jgi:hypothetical protein